MYRRFAALVAVSCLFLTGCSLRLARCGSVPPTDTVAPTASMTIVYKDIRGDWREQPITADMTVRVPANRKFVIVYAGRDNVGIRELGLGRSWTEWVGNLPRAVFPLVQSKTFREACSPRSEANSFRWRRARIYRFTTSAEDFHGLDGASPQLTVIHGTPPGPIEIP